VLVTPPDLVIEPQAGNRCVIGIELDAFGPRDVVAQILGERHLNSRDQVDHHTHLLTFGGVRRSEPCTKDKRTCNRESHHPLGHGKILSLRPLVHRKMNRYHGDAHV
jgi:hypothetical protein